MSLSTMALLTLLWLMSQLLLVAAQSSTPQPPNITAVSGCPWSNFRPVMVCSSILTPITVLGTGFNPQSLLVNLSGWLINATVNASSAVFTLQSARLLLATETSTSLSLYDMATQLSSPAVHSILLQPYTPLRLTSISGCVGSGPSTNGCSLSDGVVIITGTGFEPSNPRDFIVQYSTWQTNSYVLWGQPGGWRFSGETSLIFPLAQVANAVLLPPPPTPYGNMTLCVSRGAQGLSNCLALSWVLPFEEYIPTPGMQVVDDLAITAVGTQSSLCSNSSAGTVLNCQWPVNTLRLALTGQLAVANGSRAYITVGSGIGCWTQGSAADCVIFDGLSPLSYGTLLPLTVIDLVNQRQSAPFYGLQYAPPPPAISLLSIRGCAGDASSSSLLATSGCNAFTDVITLTGGPFLPFGAGSQQPWLAVMYHPGSGVTSLPVTPSSTSTVFIPAPLLSPPVDVGASDYTTPTTVCLSHYSRLSTSCALLSFKGPAPVVTSLSGCTGQSTSPPSVSGCVAGASALTVAGSYFLAPMTVTVAGQTCSLTAVGQTSLTCALPVVSGYVAGVGYDLVLSNPAASLTVPGAVSFSLYPTISAVTSQYCPSDYMAASGQLPPALYCTAGAQLTILGSYFSSLTSVRVLLTSALTSITGLPMVNLTCANAVVVSDSVVTCWLPTPNAQQALYAYAQPLYIVVMGNASFSSNSLPAFLYANPSAQPLVSGVRGCNGQDASSRGVVGCQPGSEITVVGDNFAGPNVSSSGLQVQLYFDGDVVGCSKPVPLSSVSLVCVLPWLPISSASVVPIRVSGLSSRPSNWLLAVGYAQTIPSAVSSSSGGGGGTDGSSDASSSYYASFVASIAVLLPLCLLSLAIAGYLLYRQSRVRPTADAAPLNAAGKEANGLSEALQMSERD